jgi:hypothetical protein
MLWKGAEVHTDYTFITRCALEDHTSWMTFLFVCIHGSDLEMLVYFDENRYERYDILSPCSKGRRVVGFNPQPLCAQGRSSVNVEWRLGRSQSQSGCFGKGK